MISNQLKKPNIILVDDHPIFRKGIKSIITIENFANVIGEASNGQEFIELLTYLKPDLVLMDIEMPVMNGMEATQRALELIPDLKIIAFTMFEDEEYFSKMIDLGAKGFILKSSDINEIDKAIKQVMKGEKYYAINHPGKTGHNPFHKNTKELSGYRIPINKRREGNEVAPPWF